MENTVYIKRPIKIHALQYKNNNTNDIKSFMNKWQSAHLLTVSHTNNQCTLTLKTLEGPLTVSPNDFIIRGIQGEFYPCKPDIFYKTYTTDDEIQNNTNKFFNPIGEL